MKNDANVKITWINSNNEKNELHFDYYNKDGEIVGMVAINKTGRLVWSIWDIEYQANILDTVSSIFGSKVENNIECFDEAKKESPIRWENALNLIKSRGLVVNYPQSQENDEEIQNSIVR